LKIGNSNEIVNPGAMYDVIFNAHYYIIPVLQFHILDGFIKSRQIPEFPKTLP